MLIYVISSHEQPTEGDPPTLALSQGVITHRKEQLVMKCYTGHRTKRSLVDTVMELR
jgi:hypothetical protein